MQSDMQHSKKDGMDSIALPHFFKRLARLKLFRLLWRYSPLVLLFAAAASSIATYTTITQEENPLGPDPKTVLELVLVNLILLLLLAVIVSYKILRLWLTRKHSRTGSRLQGRIIMMFSLVAVLPTIIMAVFSTVFFNFGIQSWFNERVSTALNSSVAVADLYLAEHKEIIRADALAMANDINRHGPTIVYNPKRFNSIVSTQAMLRSLTEALVFQRNDIIAKTPLSFSLMFDFEEITKDALDKASHGQVVVLTSESDDRVRALVKLNLFDTYLLVGRPVDARVLEYVAQAKGSVNEYQRLRGGIEDIQIRFSIIFIAVALLLLLAAIWAGMIFASALVRPVNAIVSATEHVKAGDLQTRVEEGPEHDEIATLARAFNRMTGQLDKQRSELIEVNRQIDDRRRFIEAVLLGVSAGVVALNDQKRITLFNRSAKQLLGLEGDILEKRSFEDVCSEMAYLIPKAARHPGRLIQDEITIESENDKLTFHVRVVAEAFEGEIENYIVTFDDISELQAAQRSMAWQGVARRIAHEIKNPLTPIHLAAERLRRKYSGEITSDPEMFDKYIRTITRHVGDIGKMVEEFVNFAKMPAPVFENCNLTEIIKDACFSTEVAAPDVTFELSLPEQPAEIHGDESQLTQVFTNLFKNAVEAMERSDEKIIRVALNKNKEHYVLDIHDTGEGFPPEQLDHVTDPYVTTKERGTGLGLAIVKKVIDDHDGRLRLRNNTSEDGTITGAAIKITFPTIIGSDS
jgi:two-component system nitrogen regulation sensor histidine kinase NtrY